MIRYEYVCLNCSLEFEEDHHIEDRDIPCTMECPRCKEYEVRRSTGYGGFILKGGGWAIDGYSNNPMEQGKNK